MADVITRLKIESGEYDSKIKRAVSGLQNMEQECRRVNGTLAKLEQDQKQYVQSLGQMQTVSNTVRGKIGELSGAFVELRAQYNRLTEEEKRGDYGKALSKSLDDLKNRIRDSKKELSDIQNELNGGTSKFGDFGKVIDTVGQRLGVSGSLTEMLTSKTAMMYAGIGAGIAVVGEATKAWVSYNAELAKQDQITKVTTGLEGPDSNRMTDAARAMADVYKVDFRQAIDAANTLMTQFGKTGDEAIQLLRDGMQGMVMGDGQKLLNMIKQYAPAFRDAGISASQLVAIIQNSEGGIFTDQNMNAIVMGIKNIRLMTKATSDALAKLGIDGQDMTKKLNDGTMTIFDALKQVAGAITNVNSNSQAAGEVMQQVFGRQGVSAGTNLGKAIETLNTNLQETKKQTGEVGEAYDDLLRSTEKLNTAIREAFGYNGWEEMATGIKSKLITALADVLTYLNKIRDYDMPDWLKGPGDKPKPYSGTKVDTDYITRGSSKADREKRYTTVTGNINKKLQNLNAQEAALGKPYTYTDKNGGLVEQIDTPEEVAQKRRQIQSSRQILTRRLNNIQSQHDTLTAEPVKANTIPPKTGGSTGGGRSLSASEQADAKYVQAQKDYEQSLQQAALEVKAGTINSAEAKKKELQAAETLWKSIGDAREVYDSPKLKEAQANVEAKIVALGPEVDKAIEAQKESEKAARELESKQKALADAIGNRSKAVGDNSLKSYYQANDKVVAAGGQTGALIPVEFTATQDNIAAVISELKEGVASSDIGTETFNKLTEQLSDATALGGIISEMVKQGVNTADFSEVINSMWAQLKEGDIPDEVIEAFHAKVNEKIKEKGGIQFDINANTGEVTQRKSQSNKELEDIHKSLSTVSQGLSGLSSIASGLTAMGIKLDGGIGQLFSGLQGMMQVGNGIVSIMQMVNAITSSGEIPSTVANTQALTANTIAMGSLATAIQTNTIASAIPFAKGGVIPKFFDGGLIGKAAAGMLIPGNSYSGDRLRMPVDGGRGVIGVNSGELILNMSSQDNLAAMIKGAESLVGTIRDESMALSLSQASNLADALDNEGGGAVSSTPYVMGEMIVLGANNHFKANGQGEIVTTQFLHDRGII